jgi:two-component system, chemotaxis family, protein-glutamate methylesterase/glutaminase
MNDVNESNPARFSGTVTNTSLPDMIQLLCIGRNSCRMNVRSRSEKGSICFWDGEIVHAETGGIEGEEAFYQILSWETGTFECNHAFPERETIHESWDFLLMESVRRLDRKGLP